MSIEGKNSKQVLEDLLYDHDLGADWRRGRVVDSGPRGPGFNPQPGRLSLWP